MHMIGHKHILRVTMGGRMAQETVNLKATQVLKIQKGYLIYHANCESFSSLNFAFYEKSQKLCSLPQEYQQYRTFQAPSVPYGI